MADIENSRKRAMCERPRLWTVRLDFYVCQTAAETHDSVLRHGADVALERLSE